MSPIPNRGVGSLAAAVALLGALLVALPAVAGAGSVRLGYLEFPPFTYTGTDGRARGTMIDMVRAVAADAGLELSLREGAPEVLFKEIAAGSLDLLMGPTAVPAFQGTTLVGESVIARIELEAYGLNQAPAVRRPEDLAGREAIVLRGYSYGGWRPVLEDPASRVTLVEVDSAQQGLAMLSARPGAILLDYTLPVKLALAGHGLPDLKAAMVSAVDVHFVLSRRTPDAAAVLARLEHSFQKLRDAGGLP